ncbi:unnamed protein product [Prorocentrum cordatum]|uniref:Uncharacterized protein n=1 Tax=Prorocentrum cordatum TaxID=2364126 RepID=A0ABN9U9Z5_9DINO|nr:unnamed protein product [Polarella glacialis]
MAFAEPYERGTGMPEPLGIAGRHVIQANWPQLQTHLRNLRRRRAEIDGEVSKVVIDGHQKLTRKCCGLMYGGYTCDPNLGQARLHPCPAPTRGQRERWCTCRARSLEKPVPFEGAKDANVFLVRRRECLGGTLDDVLCVTSQRQGVGAVRVVDDIEGCWGAVQSTLARRAADAAKDAAEPRASEGAAEKAQVARWPAHFCELRRWGAPFGEPRAATLPAAGGGQQLCTLKLTRVGRGAGAPPRRAPGRPERGAATRRRAEGDVDFAATGSGQVIRFKIPGFEDLTQLPRVLAAGALVVLLWNRFVLPGPVSGIDTRLFTEIFVVVLAALCSLIPWVDARLDAASRRQVRARPETRPADCMLTLAMPAALPASARLDLSWATGVLLQLTNADGLAVWKDGEVVVTRGLLRQMPGFRGGPAKVLAVLGKSWQPSSQVDGFCVTRAGISAFPDGALPTGVLPGDAEAVIAKPLPGGGQLVLWSALPGAFDRAADRGWVARVAARIGSALGGAEALASSPAERCFEEGALAGLVAGEKQGGQANKPAGDRLDFRARIAKEKTEKEVAGLQEEVQRYKKQLAEAVDGSSVSTLEYQQLFARLGKVMANAKRRAEEAVDRDLYQPGRALSQAAEAFLTTADSKKVKKYNKFTVWTFNGSGWGTIKEKLGEKLQGTLHCYAVQEHHLAEDKWPVVTQCMNAQGSQLGGAAAAPTTGPAGEAGSSAGDAVPVPKCVGMTYLYGQDKWGVVTASIYLWTAEGMSYRNRELLMHVAGQLQMLGAPWVAGGAFQVGLEALAEVECIKLVKACVIAPQVARGTCRRANGSSEIDYFIAADAVKAQVAGVRVQEEWPSTPYRLVGLAIKLKVVERKVRVLELPEPLSDTQIGRTPAPPRHGQVASFSSQAVANQEWAKYTLKLEKDAFAIKGAQRAANDPRAGGAEAPAWKIKSISFGGDNLPTAARRAIWRRWISRSLRSPQGADQRLRATTEQRDKRSREAKGQEKLFRIRGQRTKHLGTEEQGARQTRCELLAAGRWRSSAEKGELPGLYAEAAEFTLSEWMAAWRTSDTTRQQVKPWEVEAREKLGDFAEEGAAKLNELARAFRKKTGIGAEKTLAWLAHMGTVLVFMILKTFTADRVIGLLPAIIRIWEITREPNMAAEDAAWDVPFSHGMDNPDVGGECAEATIAAILDLAKAFERVSLFVLGEAGKQLKCNAGALAVVRSRFAMARGPIVGESVPEETRKVAAIIAGGKFSVGFLKLAIHSTVDGLAVERPVVKWRTCVDDLRARLRRQQQCVALGFGEALGACFENFDKMGLDFS